MVLGHLTGERTSVGQVWAAHPWSMANGSRHSNQHATASPLSLAWSLTLLVVSPRSEGQQSASLGCTFAPDNTNTKQTLDTRSHKSA